MALDRTCKAMPYIAGRMIAIAEHYAGERFGANTLSNMFTHPAYYVDVFRRYIDTNDEYFDELKDISLPTTIQNEVQKGQVWIGYYHQKAEYEEQSRGGYRPNSGRKATGRDYRLHIRLSKEAHDKLDKVDNKSETIDRLIRRHLK